MIVFLPYHTINYHYNELYKSLNKVVLITNTQTWAPIFAKFFSIKFSVAHKMNQITVDFIFS